MKIFDREPTKNPIKKEIKKRKWKWIGHMLRKGNTSIFYQAIQKNG